MTESSRVPLDRAVREQALDPERSFIVQAPAGSGKTELLTRRILTLLARVEEPEQVLAITFTRKAASEMRQRVVEQLERASAGGLPQDAYEAEGIRLAEAVLARDSERGWQLRQNPLRLNLRTIDSLAAQLARALPVASTLGAPATPTEDARELYRMAAERFVDDHLADVDQVLLQLGNRLERAIELFADLLTNRDQWQRYVLASGPVSMDELRVYLESTLADIVESRLEDLRESLPALDETRLCQCLNSAGRRAAAILAAKGGSSVEPWAEQWCELRALPTTQADALSRWQALAHAFLSKSDTLRSPKGLRRDLGFPTSKQDAALLGVGEAELRANKDILIDCLSVIESHPEFIERLIEARALPEPRYHDEQWRLLEQLFNVLPRLLLELQQVFAERQQLDFIELAARAHRALGEDDDLTDLALAMDMKLHHLLIDEFQDTSQTQFDLFARLLGGWQAGDGRSVFIVGDPMQSIYRFRDAEVTLFERARHHGIGPVALEYLQLTVNFRSSPTIVDWVNAHFAAVFPTQPDNDIGAVPYATSMAHLAHPGKVDVHALMDKTAEDEACLVAELCDAALSADDEGDIAILLRSRAQAQPIVEALRHAGLAYRSVDMDLLGERPVVRDIVSLTLALNNPQNRLHWLAVLRSPGIGLTLADLEQLYDAEDRYRPVASLLADPARRQAMSADGRERCERVLTMLQQATERSRREALMPWVESVWYRLGGPAACCAADGCVSAVDIDAAERAFRRLNELESGGRLWRRIDIERSMDKLFAGGDAAGEARIQIMTLHKSKGLEFDTVILPSLERRAGRDGTALLNWFEGSYDDSRQLLLAPIERIGTPSSARDPLNRLVRRARERRDLEEVKRLLYVACTRAKTRLHLIGRSRSTGAGLAAPVKGVLMHPLWPLFEPLFDAARATESTTDGNATGGAAGGAAGGDVNPVAATPPLLARVPLGWQMPPLDVYAPARDAAGSEHRRQASHLWGGREGRDVGTVVHRQLQIIASDIARGVTPDDREPAEQVRCWLQANAPWWLEPLPADPHEHVEAPAVHRLMQAVGMPPSRRDVAVERVLRAVSNTLKDPRGRWVLAPHDDARSEWALSTLEASGVANYIIDRSFVVDGVRWIVDFKTGERLGTDIDKFLDTQQKHYAPQLENYADIISHMDDRPVQAGLYFPLHRAFRSWQAGSGPDRMRGSPVTDR